MGGRVGARNRPPPRLVHPPRNSLSHLQRPRLHLDPVGVRALDRRGGIEHLGLGAVGRERAAVADLAAPLCVERSLIQEDLPFLIVRELVNRATVLDDADHRAVGGAAPIAEE